MRYFSVIPLPDDKKKTVSEIFRGKLPVPYINTANLHVTLNFFGELDPDSFNKLKEVFITSVSGKRFKVQFDRLVKFRNQIHATVFPSKELLDLQQRMEHCFRAKGFVFEDRPYYPHMKLANLHMDKVMHPERKIGSFPQSELKALDFEATEAVLFESKLLLHHAHHSKIETVKLD
jgi:RNA 2',3'-cyclic 3'-phosphodiesterase